MSIASGTGDVSVSHPPGLVYNPLFFMPRCRCRPSGSRIFLISAGPSHPALPLKLHATRGLSLFSLFRGSSYFSLCIIFLPNHRKTDFLKNPWVHLFLYFLLTCTRPADHLFLLISAGPTPSTNLRTLLTELCCLVGGDECVKDLLQVTV